MANGATPLPYGTATAPNTGALVVVRDEHGALSVMHCLSDDLIADPGFQQAYRAESAALAALGEPRLAEPLSYILDAGGRIVAVVRRHFPGVALDELLTQDRAGRGLDAQAAATVVSDVLVALDALHRRGVAHRRLDANQVIVGRGGDCVVVGAGLAARSLGDAGGGLGAAMAFDLAAVLELFALCVASGRMPGRDPVAQAIYTALTEARHAPLDRWEQGGVAAEMLTALESAAEQFGAGWRERGHEQLAVRARAAQKPRGNRAARSRREQAQRPNALITRSTLLSGGIQGIANPVRGGNGWSGNADGNGRGASGRRALPTWWRRAVAIAVPLVALLIAVALLRGSFSSPAPKTPPPPSLAVVTGAQAVPNSAIPGTAADSPANQSPSQNPGQSPSPSDSPSPVTANGGPASANPGTAVTSLSITSLSFTAPSTGTATVAVKARVSGTALVDVAVTVTQDGPGGPTSRTDHFTFSGQDQYTLSDNFPAMPCSTNGARQVVATVTVSATVPSTDATPATASGKLYSLQCSA